MPPCQGGCREFEPRLPLHKKDSSLDGSFLWTEIVVRIAFCELRERVEAGALLFGSDEIAEKQNAELPLNASEQDTSLVSRNLLIFMSLYIHCLKR